MYNALLDRYPTEYRGYLLRTDYRIGIQITLILEDFELDDDERMLKSLELLYGYGVPDDINVALNGLKWFMSCGRKCSDDSTTDYIDTSDIDEEVEDSVSDNGRVAYDFEIDSDLIYASMFSQYGVEIDKEKMHWFKFIAMFRCLKDTELNDLMYYRTVDISKLPKAQRADMRKLQDKYRIRKVTAQRKEELIACFGEEWKKHI